jgi:hypothetical protein
MPKANSISIPTGFNAASKASVQAALALIPTNGVDTWEDAQDDLVIIPPFLEAEIESIFSGGFVFYSDVPYALTLPAESFELATGGFAEGSDGLIEFVFTNTTAPPLLGAGQVSPTTLATDYGWDLIYDGTADLLAQQINDLPFEFTINGTAYSSLIVNSKSYITFGGSQNIFSGFSASVPQLNKIHLGPDDWSVQRIYTQAEASVYRIRWEGNTSFSAPAGSSNRFVEIALFDVDFNDVRYVEVRTGNISGSIAVPLMIASPSTALAQSTFAANQSWVFEGNSDGTAWQVFAGSHLARIGEIFDESIATAAFVEDSFT